MQVTAFRSNTVGPMVSDTILGHNIEMCLNTANGLLSNRLRNPKLMGPPHRMTGIAPEWQGATAGRSAYELTPGAGLLGSEAQYIQVSTPQSDPALHQNHLRVKAGEPLELEVWARVRHQPVTLTCQLRPLASRSEEYDSGTLTINTSYFKRYTLPLTAPRDDDEARLLFKVEGIGILWIDQVHLRPQSEPHLCRRIIDEMAQMHIPSLRFPGGTVVNAYNWKHGTGPVHLRPAMLDAAFHQDWPLNYDFGLDEYLKLCLEQNIMPCLTLNIATGTPDEAAAFAAYCAAWFRNVGVEVPQAYWHISNHPYFDTTAHMTPAMYGHVLETFIPVVKANYPASRIVAVIPRHSLTGEGLDKPWKEEVFAHHDMIDLVEFQQYGTCDPNAEPQTQIEKLTQAMETFQTDTAAFIDECHSRGVNLNVGIAEWNWWHQASHWDGRAFEEPPTVLHGLFIAGMIHRFATMAPDFEVAHFYSLVNVMGILNHRGTDIEVTDAVAIFNLYRVALPGQLIAIDLDTADNTLSKVDAMCLATDTTTWMFVVNRSHDETARVGLENLKHGGAVCEGFAGLTTTGTFRHIEPYPVNDSVEVLPLSIVRVRLTD